MKILYWKLIILLAVCAMIIMNALNSHVILDSDSKRITLYYYIISSRSHAPEFFISLTTFYPLIVVYVILFMKKDKFLSSVLALMGVFFTFLLWTLMRLHVDVTIISVTLTYYLILGLELFSSIACIIWGYTDRKKRLLLEKNGKESI